MSTQDFHLAAKQRFHLYEAVSKFKQIFLRIDCSQEGITEWAAGPTSSKFKAWEKKRREGKILPLA